MIIAPLYVLINLEDSQCKIGRFLCFIVKKGQNTLRMTIQHDAVCHVSWMGTHAAFAFEVAEALVLCGLNAFVSRPTSSITERIHLA